MLLPDPFTGQQLLYLLYIERPSYVLSSYDCGARFRRLFILGIGSCGLTCDGLGLFLVGDYHISRIVVLLLFVDQEAIFDHQFRQVHKSLELQVISCLRICLGH